VPLPDSKSTSSHDEVLVRVEGVSKKFCRSLKQSLWYGVRDIAAEMNPFARIIAGDDKSEAGDLSPPRNEELRPGEFWAVRDVSFELRRGECLGLIGHNGAGKTTLLKMLNGLILPDKGKIEMRGRVGALIALGAGFNPILSGRENIYVNGAVLGLSKREIDKKFDEIVAFSEINDAIDSPVQSYSSGMQVRLGFAVATALQPDILIVDEVLAVGDLNFRWKCIQRMLTLRASGVSILLISHNAADLMRTCDRGLMLDNGEMSYDGEISEALHHYESARRIPKLATTNNCFKGSANIMKVTLAQGVDHGNTHFDVHIDIHSDNRIEKARLIVGFSHSESGSLFSISSYLDKGWWELKPGTNCITLRASGFSLQPGTCSVQVCLRGELVCEIYDIKQSINSLKIQGPSPNYEGFGCNGALKPDCRWISDEGG